MTNHIAIPAPAAWYKLTLFVTGATPRSMRAVANLRLFCDAEFAGRYEVDIVDLYAHPERARADQVVAAPTLVRHLPKPVRYAIGDLSDTAALRAAIWSA